MTKYKLSNNNRTGRAKKNIIAMGLIRGISILISFLYVPLLLHSMNAANYGIWLTLTSVVSWLAVFDIGLGNGLRNKLGIALAENNIEKGRQYVSTAYVCVLSFLTLIFIIFLVAYPFVSWNTVLNASEVDAHELSLLVLIVFSAFCAQFVLGLLNSVLFALQLPAFSSFIQMMGQFFSFLIVLFMVKVGNINSLLILGGVVSFIPPIVMLISSIFLFRTRLKYISPSFKCYNSFLVKDILSLGIKFFILQIITIILFQTNNFIITHIINSTTVVEYNVVYKYMNILTMLFTIVAMPMWSATTEAYTKGEYCWIRSINKKLHKIILLLSSCGLLMLLLSPIVYKIWLGESDIQIRYSTTVLLYLYSVFTMLYGSYGYILNGIGKLKAQMLITTLIAILYIPISVSLGRMFGLNGILMMFLVSSIANFLWARIQFNKLMSQTATGLWNQ